MKKKFLSMLLVLSMLLALMPIMAAADTPITQTTAEITKTETDTTYNFNVEAANTYANCYVYAAIYDVNGALLAVNRVPLEMTNNTNISVDKSVYNASAKVFVWSDDMQPIIEAKEFTLTPTATLPPRPTAKPTPTLKPTATPTPTPKPTSNVTWSLDETTGTLTISGTGDMEDYSSSYLYLVPWYSKRANITNVVIEDGITSIGDYAFYYCDNLTSVTIPDSVTNIGNSAFLSCSSLTDIYYNNIFSDFAKIYIANSNNSLAFGTKLHCNNIIIDEWGKCGDTVAYYFDGNGTLIISGTGNMELYPSFGNNNIKSVIIENGVTNISNSSFRYCSDLTSITIPDSITSIGSNAFEDCSSLTSVTIPNSVTRIAYDAFANCSSLTSVTIPESITSIDYNAFYGCSKLEKVYFNATQCKEMGARAQYSEYVFCNCPSLKEVYIGDNVKSIPYPGFGGCDLDSVYITDFAAYLNIDGVSPMSNAKKLYLNNKRIAGEVTIPNSVTRIVGSAFNSCDGITSVNIPDSVISIGSSAFSGCSGLKDVYIADLAAWCNIEFGSSLSNPMRENGNLYVNNELLTNLVIPDSVTSIGNYAFCDCSNLTSVTIPDSVTSIGDYAFYNCDDLTSITIPDSVTSIGNSAFRDCCSLTSVTIPNSVTSIGSYAFYNCSSLTSINIPNSITNISKNTFGWCTGLTSVTIPDSVTSIGDNAFYWCHGLTSITIPDSITSIGSYAFGDCDDLTSVTIPDSVTSISDNAFYRCRGLKSLTIGNGITSINENTFYGCSGLTSVTIGKGITNIGSNIFSDCSHLTEIVIPQSITEIEKDAFSGCSALTTVKYCGSEEEWNEMYIGSNNDYLKNANIVFNYTAE